METSVTCRGSIEVRSIEDDLSLGVQRKKYYQAICRQAQKDKRGYSHYARKLVREKERERI